MIFAPGRHSNLSPIKNHTWGMPAKLMFPFSVPADL